MDRINGADTVDIGSGQRGFRAENLVAGVAGTEVTAEWLNSIQEEILRVVTEAGIVPSSADWSQLWQALKILGLSGASRGRRWMAVISMTLSSAPGAPAEGDAYLIPTGATGIWAGNAGKIAEWSGAAWTYFTPSDGHGIALPDGRVFERIGGTYAEKIASDVQSGKWSYAVAGGTANALTATLTPAPTALVTGLAFRLQITTPNTGAATLNLNGLGAVSITRQDGSALQAADLNGSAVLFYDGTAFRLTGVGSITTPPRNLQSWSTAGTYSFTVPTGVYKIFVTCVGGGGGAGGVSVGSNGATYPAGGGGAGGTASGWISVTPGQVISITVGAGGVGGAASSSSAASSYGAAGSAGGTSSVGSYMSATGGAGGATSGGSAGGAGGNGVGGQINQIGGNGTDGSGTTGSAIYGGNGGTSSLGGGGRAATGYAPSVQNGRAPGSGAGSVYLNWSSTGTGGTGADGIVIFQY